MKKLILGIGIIMLSSVFVIATSDSPNGITTATEAQKAIADVTPGAGDIYVPGTAEVDGPTRLDGATTVNAALTSSGLITGSSVTSTNLLTCGTITSGIAETEIYQMDQAVRTTDDVTFDTVTVTTINTGQGQVECYAMDQAVQTSDDVTFDTATITKSASVGTTLGVGTTLDVAGQIKAGSGDISITDAVGNVNAENIAFDFVAKTDSYTVTSADIGKIIRMTKTTEATFTMPVSTSITSGQMVIFENFVTEGKTLTVAPNGDSSDTVDGTTSVTSTSNKDCIWLVNDSANNNWRVISWTVR